MILNRKGKAMFETERFIAECRIALTESDVQGAIRELVEKAGRRAWSRKVDVRDRAGLHQAIADGVAAFDGRLDVVIPNAGIAQLGSERPLSTFTEIVDINLSGVLNTVHGALPYLGSI